MQDLRITLVQADQRWEDKAANLAHFDILLEKALPTDLILLPEMFHTGFSMQAKALAEKMDDSSAMRWLTDKAAEKNSAIYTSFIAEENGAYYNRGVFMLPDGSHAIYDKRKLFSLAGEHEVYTAGSEKKIIEYKGWKILLQICYDLRFPEIARNSLDSNHSPVYDVILYVANWPERRSAHWKALLTARAIENQCFVAGLNRVGEDGKGLRYSGDSSLTDALGNQAVTFEVHKESLQTATLQKAGLDEIRKQLAFLKDADPAEL